MTSIELPTEVTTPSSIMVDEANNTVTIVMPLAPMTAVSVSGKMALLATSNGWIKTDLICPRTAQQIQVNLFVGTRI